MTYIKKLLVSAFLIMFLSGLFSMNQVAHAEYYKVNLTRVDQDLYKDTSSEYYFKTFACYEFVYYEDAIYNSSSKELIFNSGSSYQVTGIMK